MRGLTILVPTDDRVRFRAALSLACAQAALGGRVRVFCQEEAVSLLLDRPDPDGDMLRDRGLPDTPELITAAHDMDVILIACQTGLSAASLGIHQLYGIADVGGLVGLLATQGDDRLVIA